MIAMEVFYESKTNRRKQVEGNCQQHRCCDWYHRIFAFYRFDELRAGFDVMIGKLFPFIFGFAIAFLLDKPMMMFEEFLKKVGLKGKGVRNLAAILALILGFIMVSALLWLLIPQVLTSLFDLIEKHRAILVISLILLMM